MKTQDIDKYAQALIAQNNGGVCADCGNSLGHQATCPLINRETAEAKSIVDGLLNKADVDWLKQFHISAGEPLDEFERRTRG